MKINQLLDKYSDDSAEFTLIQRKQEKGFSLVEVVVAMTILLIVLLGVFATFTYAVSYNAGNNARSQALTVLQQEVELLRSKKFTPTITDPELQAGIKPAKAVKSADGNGFVIETTVVDVTTTIKEINVKVSLANPTPGWRTSIPAVVILRRVRAN
jgi:prepilin-type N-terminal cleavage/methylation domain-containing protein